MRLDPPGARGRVGPAPALVLLASKGPLRTVDVARALEIHPSTVTRTCDRLVRRGLVMRQQDDADRRAVRLTLTPESQELMGQVMRRRKEHLGHLITTARVRAGQDAAEVINALVEAAGEPTEGEWWRCWAQSTSSL